VCVWRCVGFYSLLALVDVGSCLTVGVRCVLACVCVHVRVSVPVCSCVCVCVGVFVLVGGWWCLLPCVDVQCVCACVVLGE
jgi:hypothetical protein